MALTEIVLLDIQNAQRTIDRLEQQLAQLGQPIDVPVDISGEQELAQIRRELGLSDDAAERLNRELSETDAELRQAGSQARRTGDDIESAGRRGGTAFGSLRSSVIGLVGAFGAIQGARAFLDFAGDSIDAASDLEESTSKAQVVFGEFFDDIQAFSQTAPQALGLANAQALEFAGTFGNLFVALGLSQQAAADLSPEIVQLGADLASFNNIEVTEALDKLRAGLVGEAEPLRALGVNLTAASTAAKAVELGLAASTTEVSEAAKVQARYALILEQTATAQGDFARTADGIANRQRTLAAEFENLRASLGEALLPAFETLLEIIPSLVSAVEQVLIPAFAGLSSSVESFDADSFIAFVAGLPSGIETTASQFSSAAQAFGNAFQVFGSIAMLNFGDVGDQFRQLGEDIQSFRGAGAANEAVQNLIQTLATGTEPVAALESVLAALGENVSSLTLEQFEPLAAQLIAMATAAGASAPELAALADVILQFGEDAGFSAAGIEILADALRGPLATAQAEASAGDIIAANLAAAGEAAAAATPEIENFASTLREVEAPDFAAEISALEQQFSKLPDGLDAAAEALRDKEGEIREDFTGFLNELESELERGAEFRAGIIQLEDLGLDEVADAFRNLGPESLELLRDALANPTEAIVANDLLAEDAAAVAQDFRDQLAADILEAGPLDLTLPVNLTAVINALDIEGLPNGAAQGNQIREGARLQNINVTQNFDNTPSPNTETARAAQQINAIVNVE